MRSMIDIRHDLAMRRTIGAQLVGNNPLRRDALLLQKSSQQSFGSLGIATGLDDLVKDIAILINSAPQPVSPAGNSDERLVQMPHAIPAGLLTMKATCIVWAKLLCPAADRFIGDDNATLQQHLFNKTQAQRKSEVEPHCVCDGLGRETMALVADG